MLFITQIASAVAVGYVFLAIMNTRNYQQICNSKLLKFACQIFDFLILSPADHNNSDYL